MIKILTYEDLSAKVEIKDPEEYIQKHWMDGNFYECGRNGLLKHLYKYYRDKVFVDVGACIGNHTLFMAKISKKVIAFEPVKDNYVHLIENIKLNNLTNVEAFEKALSDLTVTSKIVLGEKGNNGSYEVSDKGSEIISMWRMDSVIKEHIDVIKIDVEGHNVRVLRGAYQTLETYMPDVFIECHKGFLDETADMFHLLEYYQVKGTWNPSPTYLFRHLSKNKK